MEERELAIIGGGPAGITAGLYAARSRLDVILFEKSVAGGAATLTEHIENYPGFPGGITGSELGSRMAEQARGFGLEMRLSVVQRLQVADGYFLLGTGSGDVVARSVILATGTRPRSLEVPGEREFLGRGVSYCATCDGPLFEGC
ncbi:MAG: FAD-dependent oxidoreductase, partial [Firmicutes bacterium]|nr:FAD-dependent oxidoreductase [Bacillota bacterium]